MREDLERFIDLYGIESVLDTLEKYYTGKLVVKENDSLHSVKLPLADAELLSDIIRWYRMQIVNHGLPDRKKYREFCKKMEIELLGNDESKRIL